MRAHILRGPGHNVRPHHDHPRSFDDAGGTSGPRRRGRPGGLGPRGFRHQARRGAVREAVLALLTEQPMHGYQIMQELESRSGGRWRPSAGSIYPTLEQLQDEDLVAVEELDGRRTFKLTEAGLATAAGLPGQPTWTGGRGGSDDLRGLSRDLGLAAMQVARAGSPAAVAEAGRVLAEARRSLYRLLADDAPTTVDATEG